MTWEEDLLVFLFSSSELLLLLLLDLLRLARPLLYLQPQILIQNFVANPIHFRCCTCSHRYRYRIFITNTILFRCYTCNHRY
jgi:hypothetical protein